MPSKTGLPKVMSGEMEREEYYENEVVTKSGKLIYWNNVNQRRHNKELLCSGIDITERKHSEVTNKSQG
jgi:hypothetical protein